MGAVADISRRLLLQSNPAVDGLVRDDIAVAIANGLDAAALNGAGSSGVPLGLLQNGNIGIQAGGTNGAALTWANRHVPAAADCCGESPGRRRSSGVHRQRCRLLPCGPHAEGGELPDFLAQYEENSNVRIAENAWRHPRVPGAPVAERSLEHH
jgi:hypothetical protein